MKVMKKISALIFVLLLTFSFAGSAFAVDVRVDTDSYLQNLPSPARVRNGEFFVSRQVEEYADGSVAVVDVYSGPAVITRAGTSRWYTAYNDWVGGNNTYANLWARGYFTYDASAETVYVSNASGDVSAHSSNAMVGNKSTTILYGGLFGGTFGVPKSMGVRFSCVVAANTGNVYYPSVECWVNCNGAQF